MHGDYRGACYTPWNLASRTLTCDGRASPWAARDRAEARADAAENDDDGSGVGARAAAADALARLDEFAWVSGLRPSGGRRK